jgi:hypothetical protein
VTHELERPAERQAGLVRHQDDRLALEDRAHAGLGELTPELQVAEAPGGDLTVNDRATGQR